MDKHIDLKAKVAEYFGYISIFFWVFAQSPQLYSNWKNKQSEAMRYQQNYLADISLLFLSNWILGDLCNLVGGLLTNQLPFQIMLAIYFVAVDTALLIQCLYLAEDNGNNRPSPIKKRLRFCIGAIIIIVLLTVLLYQGPQEETQDAQLIGQVISWICCCLYLSSRIPQVRCAYI
jgi:hypothetical protein